MIVRRTLLVALLGITGIALQTSLFGELTLTGTKPELLLLLALALAIEDGPALGASAGFTFGLLTDAFLEQPAGVSALTFTLACYGVGRIRAQLQAPSAWMPTIMISATTLVVVLAFAMFLALLGEPLGPPVRVLRHAVLAAAYNALLTPLLFPLVRALVARSRPHATEVMR
jgi:rod shape-determining protein MreD